MTEPQNRFRVDFKPKNTALAVIILLLAVFILLAVFFAFQKEYSVKIKTLEQKLLSAYNAKMAMQKSLKNAVQGRRALKFSLGEERERNKALNTQLNAAFYELSVKKSEVLALGSENKNLKDQMAGLKTENSSLGEKLQKTDKDNADLTQRLGFLETAQDNLQKKIRRLLTRTRVELGEVVIRPADINGKIIKASSKYNFVIIDLGKNDGIKVGANLMAYRGDNPIGAVKIEKVYDELSVGSADFEWHDKELAAGDTVKGQV